MVALKEIALTVRKAAEEDADLLWRWRNDPHTRAQSRDPRPIDRERHEGWLARKLSSADCDLYVIERAGEPVGSVRVDRTVDRCEVSWMVAPEARGSGVGKQMVRLVCNRYNDRMFAEIKRGNLPSAAIARYAGFKHVDTDGDLMLFEKLPR